MRQNVVFAGLLLGSLIGAAPGVGQTGSATQGQEQAQGRGEELTIYLMTMGPGTAVWERFGHNAIRVRDAAAGTDIAYNYGMFSFDQENFILRFIRGEMDYWTEGFPAQLMADAYIQTDRSVWLQELNLSPTQRAELRDFLMWNAQPENRIYRYNYYTDNCSTRVRDAIDLAVGGQLRAQMEGTSTGTTYRDHTRALTIGDPLLYSGLMVGLGQPVDRPISAWEEMFLPMRLRDLIQDVTIQDESGRTVPLVLGEQELYRSTKASEQPIPSGRVWPFLAIGLAFGGLIAFSGRRFAERWRWGGLYAWLVGVWAVLAGALGLVLLALWAFTDHTAAYRNENIFFLSPFLLMLAFTIPAVLRRGGGRAARTVSMILGFLVALLSIVGLILQVLPGLFQDNGEIIALALPINLAVAISLYWIWSTRRAGDPSIESRRLAGGRTAAFAR